jgi:hypothetical protein
VHPGGCPDPGANGNDYEAIVDAEWASAAAPSADLQVVSCADTTTVFGGLIAVQNLVNQRHVPPIISFSYGNCEAQNGAAANAAYKAAYLQAVLEGASVFVAAGDNGAAFCDFLSPLSLEWRSTAWLRPRTMSRSGGPTSVTPMLAPHPTTGR